MDLSHDEDTTNLDFTGGADRNCAVAMCPWVSTAAVAAAMALPRDSFASVDEWCAALERLDRAIYLALGRYGVGKIAS